MKESTFFDFNSHEFFLFGLFASLSLLPFFTPGLSYYFASLFSFNQTLYTPFVFFVFILAHLPYVQGSRGSAFQVFAALVIGVMICNSFFFVLKGVFTWIGAYFVGALVFWIYISLLAMMSVKKRQKK